VGRCAALGSAAAYLASLHGWCRNDNPDCGLRFAIAFKLCVCRCGNKLCSARNDVGRTFSEEGMMMGLQQWGAFGFGLVIGWFLYFVNRYRKDDVTFGDLTTVIGAVGGGAVTALFGAASADLFGAYGIGLASGFFGYFLVLIILVAGSKSFGAEYFLDGRRIGTDGVLFIPGEFRQPTMAMDDDGATPGQ
jgi:hypothetical protein